MGAPSAGFGRLWTAATVGNLGDGVGRVAVGLLAAGLTRDPLAVAAVTALSYAPWLAFGLPAGVLVDRYDRRRLAAWSGIVRASAVAVLTVAAATDRASLWLLYAVVLLLFTCETVYDNAVASMTPMVVTDHDQLERANGRLQGGMLIAETFVGPPLASMVFALAAAYAFGINVACYAMAVVMLLTPTYRRTMDSDPTGQGYLEHLTDEDLLVLADSAGLDGEQAAELRRRPAQVLELADRAELFDRVYGSDDPAGLVRLSPFLAFLAAVGQARREIAATPYVAERSAPRQLVPVFDAPQLRDFLADPTRRLFLAELLTSFVRVASGRYWTRTARGWRSRRYSELDPVRLAQFAENAPRSYQPGVYRRLGDVSLFLTGVFPDYAQQHAFGPFDVARLLRAAGLAPEDDTGLATAPPIQLLEHLGQRWYRRASELAPVATAQLAVVAQVADRFRDARRVLNHIADRYFARIGNPWFGPPGSPA